MTRRAFALDGFPEPPPGERRPPINGRYVTHCWSGRGDDLILLYVKWPGSKAHVGDRLPAPGEVLTVAFGAPRPEQRTTVLTVEVIEATESASRPTAGVLQIDLSIKGRVR